MNKHIGPSLKAFERFLTSKERIQSIILGDKIIVQFRYILQTIIGNEERLFTGPYDKQLLTSTF